MMMMKDTSGYKEHSKRQVDNRHLVDTLIPCVIKTPNQSVLGNETELALSYDVKQEVTVVVSWRNIIATSCVFPELTN